MVVVFLVLCLVKGLCSKVCAKGRICTLMWMFNRILCEGVLSVAVAQALIGTFSLGFVTGVMSGTKTSLYVETFAMPMGRRGIKRSADAAAETSDDLELALKQSAAEAAAEQAEDDAQMQVACAESRRLQQAAEAEHIQEDAECALTCAESEAHLGLDQAVHSERLEAYVSMFPAHKIRDLPQDPAGQCFFKILEELHRVLIGSRMDGREVTAQALRMHVLQTMMLQRHASCTKQVCVL